MKILVGIILALLIAGCRFTAVQTTADTPTQQPIQIVQHVVAQAELKPKDDQETLKTDHDRYIRKRWVLIIGMAGTILLIPTVFILKMKEKNG